MQNLPAIPIERIEAAINILCALNPNKEDVATLCAPARPLAKVYGLMIYRRQTHIDWEEMEAISNGAAQAYEAAFTA
jgi:hypothetical protein